MIGWGIIGVGDVTEVKAAPAIFRTADSGVVNVMRRDGAKAEDFARRHGVARWSTEADAVIHDPDVTAVYVATPTSTHAPYALDAIRAGKHVLIEKPMALDATECRAIVDAAEDAGVRVWVAYYRRALPRFDRVRELLVEGAIGRVLAIDVAWQKPSDFTGWRWDADANPGGEFLETACHTLDILDHLLGPASDAAGAAGDGAKAVSGSWKHGDVVASGSWTFGTATAHEQVLLHGTDGSLSFETFAPTPIVVTTASGAVEHPVFDPPHVHGPLVATILDELRGGAECPSSGQSALRTAEITDALLGR